MTKNLILKVASRHLASTRLEPSDIRKINEELRRIGFDGNYPWKSVGESLNALFGVLEDYGVEPDQVLSANLFNRPQGTTNLYLAFTNREDLFSPVSITNTMVFFQWHKKTSHSWEVVAYLSLGVPMNKEIPFLLAYLRNLSLEYETEHWQASSFSEHNLFERLQGSSLEHIDALAEKLIQEQDIFAVDLQEQMKWMTQIQKVSQTMTIPKKFLTLEGFLKKLLVTVKTDLDKKECLTMGIEDSLAQIASENEIRLYLLQQQYTC